MGKTTTDMQLVPIGKLVPYANNARTHSPEQVTKLRSSLREFGFINPVIIDRDFVGVRPICVDMDRAERFIKEHYDENT